MDQTKDIERTTWVAMIAIAVIVLLFVLNYHPTIVDEGQTPDEVSSYVQQGLDSADLGDVEGDLKLLDADINKL